MNDATIFLALIVFNFFQHKSALLRQSKSKD